jgi:hypothetical protein
VTPTVPGRGCLPHGESRDDPDQVWRRNQPVHTPR